MLPKNRRIHRKHILTDSVSVATRKTVSGLLSMKTTAAFRSEIEMAYRHGHLNRRVMSHLFSELNSNVPGFSISKKRKLLEIASVYNSKV